MALIIKNLGCHNRPSEYSSMPRIPARWTYTTKDNLSTLLSLGYFNLAYQTGMRDGDTLNIGYIDELNELPTTTLGVIREEGEHFRLIEVILSAEPSKIVTNVTGVLDIEVNTGIHIADYINSVLDTITIKFYFDKDGKTYGIKDTAGGGFLEDTDIRIVRSVTVGNSR